MEYDFFDEPGDNEHEITIEEFQNITFRDEFEIDLDDFTDYLLNREEEQIIEDEYRSRMDDRAASMNDLLEHGRYFEAFSESEELRKRAYADYKDEIEHCLEICVKNDVPDALIRMAHKHIDPNVLKIKPEGFIYLKKLSDMGYIESFRWLADCYYHGWGCDRDLQKAKKLYFEGLVFDQSKYCRQRYAELYDENDYPDNELLRQVIACILEPRRTIDECALARIALFMRDGVIKGYGSKAVYVLLKNTYSMWTWDGIFHSVLGECLLHGIGTEANPVVAFYILKDAVEELNLYVNYPDDEKIEYMISEAYFEYEDYVNIFDKTKLMLAEAVEKTEKKVNYCFMGYDFRFDDDIYDEWEDKKERFISRTSES